MPPAIFWKGRKMLSFKKVTGSVVKSNYLRISIIPNKIKNPPNILTKLISS